MDSATPGKGRGKREEGREEPVPDTQPLTSDTHEEARQRRRGWLVFCPQRSAECVLDVTAEELKANGIRGVILDLDNTLVLWQQEEMTEEVVAWLESLKAAGLKLCILSNSILSKRSERIAARLGCPNVRMARKPARSGFKRAMEAMGTAAQETAIIGDQVFTDIWGGNRAGIYTILVQPIHPREFPYTRFVSRPLERLLLHHFRRRGHL